ncbi:MAG: heavy metal-binding domain-containing protein [Candidatus Omnitrophota bacterium]
MRDLIQFLILFGIGYFVGTKVEKAHYSSLIARERIYLPLPVVTVKRLIDKDKEIEKGELVCGSVVIAPDYFKLILAGLRNILGGEVSSYETLLDRGRR